MWPVTLTLATSWPPSPGVTSTGTCGEELHTFTGYPVELHIDLVGEGVDAQDGDHALRCGRPPHQRDPVVISNAVEEHVAARARDDSHGSARLDTRRQRESDTVLNSLG